LELLHYSSLSYNNERAIKKRIGRRTKEQGETRGEISEEEEKGQTQEASA
jgi:hypothetical protein